MNLSKISIYISKTGIGFSFGILGLLFTLFYLSSCNDTLSSDEIQKEEDFTGITILVPNTEGNIGFTSNVGNMGTRGYDISQETAFKDLCILAFYNNGQIVEIYDNLRSYGTTADGYTIYRIAIDEGYYKFYVLANLNDYISGGVKSLNQESQLKNLSLTFNENEPLEPGNLPMVCYHDNLKVNGGSQGSGPITISKNSSTTIKADLTYLCAKVRYTILFDKREGGFSEAFGSHTIRFDMDDQPRATNVGGVTALNDGYTPVNGIINPDFSYDGEWDGTTKIENHVGEVYERATFDVNQTIDNLSKGYYKLEVQGFFRNGPGTWGDENIRGLYRHNNGTEKLFANLYISDKNYSSQILLKSLYSEKCEPYNNHFTNVNYPYPDGTADSNDAFNQENKYYNSITFYHSEDGPITIGIKRTEWSDNVLGDWTCFDNFRLFYKSSSETTTANHTWNIPLDKYTFNWPVTQNPEYPVNPDYVLSSWSGTEESNWNNLECKAWQGIAYFPENITSDNSKKTTLHFPYGYGDASDIFGEKSLILFASNDDSTPKDQWNGSEVNNSIERGKMYDVVIRVKSIDDITGEVKVEVRVRPWEYHPEEEVW